MHAHEILLPLQLDFKTRETMLQFISFGSGSCGNCYYLGDDKDAILIDAGVGIRRLKRNMRDYGINFSNIRGILITHDHADHIKAAGYLSGELQLNVYATLNIHEGMKNNYNALKKVDAAHIRYIETEQTFQLGEFRITAYKMPHDSTENVGYKIEHGGKVFTIVTDIGAPTDRLKYLISVSNYLVIESNYDEEMLVNGKYPQHLKERIMSGTGHLSNAQTAAVLTENFHEHLSHVWLCHLSEENNHPELARKTIDFKLRSYGIIAGKDFSLEVLRRKLPTGVFELE